nr:MAG TPA: hypothetical protein [Caudoviricetes sp.]
MTDTIGAQQQNNTTKTDSRRGAAERKIKNGKMETEPDGGKGTRHTYTPGELGSWKYTMT